MDKIYYSDINNAETKSGNGQGVRSNRDKFTCAIKTSYANESKDDIYEVRLDKNGKLYNPYGAFADELTEMQRRSKTGHDFEEVSEEIFDLYLRFLNSYRAGHLRSAENLRSQPKQRVLR